MTSRIDAGADALYNFVMPDGDAFSVLLHQSDYIDGSVPVRPDQINQIMNLCRALAKSVLDAADAAGNAAADTDWEHMQSLNLGSDI